MNTGQESGRQTKLGRFRAMKLQSGIGMGDGFIDGFSESGENGIGHNANKQVEFMDRKLFLEDKYK